MKLPIIAALAASFALSACSDTDWSHTMSFIGYGDDAQPAPMPASNPVARAMPVQSTPAQTAQAAGTNPFCASVARQDSEAGVFDAATQQGVFVRSYQQCVMIFGNATPQ